jgi:hypothetical protein
MVGRLVEGNHTCKLAKGIGTWKLVIKNLDLQTAKRILNLQTCKKKGFEVANL